MESSASKCNRALPSAIEPICFGGQLRQRYTLKSDIYQLSVLIAGPLLGPGPTLCEKRWRALSGDDFISYQHTLVAHVGVDRLGGCVQRSSPAIIP